jgi:hypothetical protein
MDIVRMPREPEADVHAGGAPQAAQEQPVAHSSTSDMAICETTSTLRKVQRRPGRASTSSPFSAPARMGRGRPRRTSPNSSPAPTLSANV